MRRRANAESDASLVPFMQRVRGMQACRVLLSCVLIAAAVLFPVPHGYPGHTVAWACGGYLVLTCLTLLASRMRRGVGVALFGAALLVDGAFLAAMTYAQLGFRSPLVGLVLLHLVAVTLLASFRTGLKIAIWHTLLMMSAYQLQQSGMLYADGSTQRVVTVAVVMLWVVTLATSTFASVNERELRRHNFDLAALARLSLQFEGSMLAADVATTLVAAVCEDQGVERAVLLGVSGGRLDRVAGQGDAVPQVAANPAADHLIRIATAGRRSLRVPRVDARRDPWLSQALPDAANLILVPFYADGAVAGVVVAEHGSRRGSRVERRVLEMLERYASHAALALKNAQLLEQVRELADSDGLTGVANRRTFDRILDQGLARAAVHDTPVSLVLVDIDHFKSVNDTYGHQVGDTVLREVAAALTAVCRRSDLVARYGGEEFAIVLPGSTAENAASFAERLRLAVAAACDHPPVTASFGVATSVTGRATSEWLIATADAALYRSKQDGRNRVTVGVVEQEAPAQRAPAGDGPAAVEVTGG